MSLTQLLSHWRAEPSIGANIVEWRNIQTRAADFSPFPEDLHPEMAEILEKNGIQNLYSHQKLTWDISNAGENVVVVTGTASGKTLAYNLPIINHLFTDKSSRALYLFPTKALSQDQYEGLQELTGAINYSAPVSILLRTSRL